MTEGDYYQTRLELRLAALMRAADPEAVLADPDIFAKADAHDYHFAVQSLLRTAHRARESLTTKAAAATPDDLVEWAKRVRLNEKAADLLAYQRGQNT